MIGIKKKKGAETRWSRRPEGERERGSVVDDLDRRFDENADRGVCAAGQVLFTINRSIAEPNAIFALAFVHDHDGHHALCHEKLGSSPDKEFSIGELDGQSEDRPAVPHGEKAGDVVNPVVLVRGKRSHRFKLDPVLSEDELLLDDKSRTIDDNCHSVSIVVHDDFAVTIGARVGDVEEVSDGKLVPNIRNHLPNNRLSHEIGREENESDHQSEGVQHMFALHVLLLGLGRYSSTNQFPLVRPSS